MKKVLKFSWKCAQWIYFPIYALAWALHKMARLMLAISYFGMLESRIGKDIIKSLFE